MARVGFEPRPCWSRARRFNHSTTLRQIMPSKSKVVHLQWIPGHSSLPGNDLAEPEPLLIPPKYQCPLHPLFPLNDYPSTPVGDAVSNMVSFNTNSLQYLPRSLLSLAPLAVLIPVYAATGLNTYLHRVGRAETPSCSNCGSKSQDLSHLVLDCPVLDHLRRAIFSHSLPLLDLWSRP